MTHVAIIGTQGVPAKYGGFETLVENILGENTSPGVDYTVFCSARDYALRMVSYKGARIRYVPFFHANGAQSTPYDVLSMLLCLGRGFDAVLVLGVSGCLLLPVFRWLYGGRLVVNIDGLEHRRAKWGRFARWFLRRSEALAVRSADVVVADNRGIQDYVRQTYGKPSALIAYGGDHVQRTLPAGREAEILRQYGVGDGAYAITVCRIEPENNSRMLCEAARESGAELLFIGNWAHSAFGRDLRDEFSRCPHIHCIDAVYDLDVLYTLRSHCRCYLHGHSAGGTNPSLVEAMWMGRPILAFDVNYNRYTTGGLARYFSTAADLAALLAGEQGGGEALRQYARDHYTWRGIARQYEALYAAPKEG